MENLKASIDKMNTNIANFEKGIEVFKKMKEQDIATYIKLNCNIDSNIEVFLNQSYSLEIYINNRYRTLYVYLDDFKINPFSASFTKEDTEILDYYTVLGFLCNELKKEVSFFSFLTDTLKDYNSKLNELNKLRFEKAQIQHEYNKILKDIQETEDNVKREKFLKEIKEGTTLTITNRLTYLLGVNTETLTIVKISAKTITVRIGFQEKRISKEVLLNNINFIKYE